MRVDRLETLIEILCEVRDAKRAFDLTNWAVHVTEEQPKDEYCGTTACALGYGALDRRLSDQGLKLVIEYTQYTQGQPQHSDVSEVSTIHDFNQVVHQKDVYLKYCYIRFKGFSHYQASQEFFEFAYYHSFDKSTTHYLFSSNSYEDTTDINEVIKRIQNVIETDEQCARDYFMKEDEIEE